jgi:predicted glycosyltransferase
MDEANQLVSHDKRISVARALDRRKKMIRVTFDNLRPVVVLVELFPFGPKEICERDTAATTRRPRPTVHAP